MYYMGFTHNEAYALPIWQRTWFIDRLVKEMQASNGEQGTRAPHDNTQEARELRGRNRTNPPARLRRFT